MYTTKTNWYVTGINQGSIGSPSDFFGAVTTADIKSPNSYWDNVTFKIYISNTTTTQELPIIFS